MSKSLLAVPTIVWAVAALTSSGAAGQDTPISLPGLTTNQLSQPGQPTNFSNYQCSGGTSLTYQVAATDFTGGSTMLGTSASVAGCTQNSGNLGPANYIFFTVPAVSGAAGCNIYRNTSGNQATLVATNVRCGSTFYDFGGGTTVTIPSSNTTGGVNSAGAVVATIFNASNGNGFSGANILTQATTAVPSCATNPPPCITNGNEFFFQAPVSTISKSWGITVPNSAPVPPQLEMEKAFVR